MYVRSKNLAEQNARNKVIWFCYLASFVLPPFLAGRSPCVASPKGGGAFPLRCSQCRPKEFDRFLEAAAPGQQGVNLMFVVLRREKTATAKAFSDCPFRESVRKEESFRFHYLFKTVFAPPIITMSMKRERENRRNGGTYLSEEIAHPVPLNHLLL